MSRSHSARTATLVFALGIVIAGCASKRPEPPANASSPTSSAGAVASTTVSSPSAAVSEPSNTSPAASSAPHLQQETARYETIVSADDRAAEDRALDAGRHPVELLAFFGVQPGMRVAEIAAGGGYTAELLARAVGPKGKVYAQNSKWILERFAEKPWRERLGKPVMKNVVRVDREFESPLPPEAKDLDLVVNHLFYHDTVWLKTDRDKMNRAIFAALRPGGAYVIIDHSARTGAGTSEAETLHRIEEKVVRDEVQKAGFHLEGEGTFLRNPDDARDWNTSPRAAGIKRGASDRFALKFVKP